MNRVCLGNIPAQKTRKLVVRYYAPNNKIDRAAPGTCRVLHRTTTPNFITAMGI